MLLDRMVLRELAGPLVVGVLAILQLFVLVQLLQLNEIVFSGGMRLSDLGNVALALAPHFLVLALPLAYMMAIQLALGRLAADGELLALSSAGISPLRLFRIPLAVAAVLAAVVFALTRWAEPWGLQRVNAVLNEVIKRNLQAGISPGIFNDNLPRFTVYVAELDEQNWRGVLIDDQVGDGAPLLVLAEEGHIADTGGEALSLRLRHGELHRSESNGETVVRFRLGTFLVGVQERVARKNRFYGVEAALPYDELTARADEYRKEGLASDVTRMLVEKGRRWAVPLACVCFAVLGVPLAVFAGRARGSAYLVTVGSFVIFYTTSRLGLAYADRGLPVVVAAFAPDLVILAIALPLTRLLMKRGVA